MTQSDDALQWAEAYSPVFPLHQLLIKSYARAQAVARKAEPLDSQRA